MSAAITMLLGFTVTGNTYQAIGADASGDSGPPIKTSLIALPKPQMPLDRNLSPFQPLHGGAFSGPAVPLSPDPIVRYQWPDTSTTNELQYYLLRPVKVFTDEPGSFDGLKSASKHHCNITVRGTGSLRFDFGVESAAWLEFDSSDMPGGVEMGVSEFTAPAWEHDIAAPTLIGSHTYALKLKGKFDYNGVRFGTIYIRSFDGRPWHITNVRLVCQIKPTNYKGSFSCSDPMLTKIWYTGAYTVKLNLEQNLIGAILMDRGDRVPWAGDDHIAQGAALAAFGDWDVVAQNIDDTAHNYNRIPSYALYWVLSVMDYYNYTGDRAFLMKYIPNVQDKLTQAEGWFADPTPRFYGWDDRVGSGFIDSGCDEACQAYRMLFIDTCRQFAQAMGTIGRDDLQNQYQQTADHYTQVVQAAQPDWVNRATIFAASDAINAGVPTAAQQDILYRRVFANPVGRVSLSSFNEFFILKAMGRMGWTDQALQTTLEDWGGQINNGGTTFYECYWPSWNAIVPQNGPIPSNQAGVTSLCHPWSAGCTTWLTRYVAGIEPTAPGFATVDVTPHLGRLLTRVAADAPTPHGNIHWSFDATKGRAELVIPDGITARVGIPALDRTIDSIRINGQVAWNGSYQRVPAIDGAVQRGDSVYFTGVGPGHYTFNIQYSGTTPPYVAQPLVYPDPVNARAQDDTTSGNWGGVYGKDGYVLLGYDVKGTNLENRENLPSYVQSVTCKAGKFTQWDHDVSDARALASNGRNEGARTAASYYNRCTVTVDVHLKQPHPYRLAAYVVDFDHQDRQEAVDIYNQPALTLAAPTQAVREYQKGKYVIFDCHDSVRLRFDTIAGSNAVVSGIFFDPDSIQQAKVEER